MNTKSVLTLFQSLLLFIFALMGIEEEIKQSKKFQSEYHKLAVNILYTGSWIYNVNLQRLKPFGISPEQFNVLRILRGQYPKPATVKMLIERMIDKNSNASRIVEKLRAKELLIRKENDGDRRQVDIVISDKGLELLEKIDIIEKDLTKGFNLSEKEAQQLNELLDRLRG